MLFQGEGHISHPRLLVAYSLYVYAITLPPLSPQALLPTGVVETAGLQALSRWVGRVK